MTMCYTGGQRIRERINNETAPRLAALKKMGATTSVIEVEARAAIEAGLGTLANELGVNKIEFYTGSGGYPCARVQFKTEPYKDGKAFDPHKLLALSEALGPDYDISVSDDHLAVSFRDGKKTSLTILATGTKRELARRSYLKKSGKDYVPVEPDKVLEPTQGTVKTGFLITHDETVYQVLLKTVDPVVRRINAETDGRTYLAEKDLGSDKAQAAIDAAAKELFNWHPPTENFHGPATDSPKPSGT